MIKWKLIGGIRVIICMNFRFSWIHQVVIAIVMLWLRLCCSCNLYWFRLCSTRILCSQLWSNINYSNDDKISEFQTYDSHIKVSMVFGERSCDFYTHFCVMCVLFVSKCVCSVCSNIYIYRFRKSHRQMKT